MTRLRSAFVLAVLLAAAAPVRAQTTWVGSNFGTRSWIVGSNWSTGVFPDSAGASVNLARAWSGIDIGLNQQITLGSLTIGNTTSTADVFLSAGSGGGSLVFDNNSSDATLTTTGNGTVYLTPTVTINGTGNLNVTANANLELWGRITGSGAWTSSGARTVTFAGGTGSTLGSLSIGGGGTVAFDESLISAGGATMTIGNLTFAPEGGNLHVTNNSRLTSTGATSATAVAGTSTSILVDAGGDLITGQTSLLAYNKNVTATVDGAGSTWTLSSLTMGNPVGSVFIPGTTSLTVRNSGSVSVVGTTDLTSGRSNDLYVYSGGVFSTGGFVTGGSGATEIHLTGAGALVVGAGGASSTFGGVISDYSAGAGGITKTGSGTFTLTGANTYTGGTVISGGTLQIGNGGTTGSITGNVTDNAALAFNRSDAVTFAGVISGTGSLTQSGAGTLTLTGANTYTGGTTISSGTLQIGSGGTTGSITGNITDNATLAFNRSNAVTYSGVLSGAGSLIQNGAGTLTLSGTGSSIGKFEAKSGTVNITGGLTTQGGSGRPFYIYSGAAGVNVTGGGDVIVSGNAFAQNAPLTVSGAGSTFATAAFYAWQGAQVTLSDNASFNTTYYLFLGSNSGLTNDRGYLVIQSGADLVSGNAFLGENNGDLGTVSLTGAGSTLTSTNIYLGGESATGAWGEITVLQNAAVTVTHETLLSDSASFIRVATGGSYSTGSLTNADGTTPEIRISRAGALTVGTDDSSSTYSGTIIDDDGSDPGGVIKTGSGVWTLTGSNTYFGGTVINGGELRLGDGGTTGSIIGSVTVTGSGALAFNRSDNLTFSTAINGTGGLTKYGTNTLTLSGANTYSGPTTISAGTLALSASHRLGDSTALTVASGATFNLNGFTETIGSLAGAGGVTLGAGALTVGGDNTSTTFSGEISGTGSFTKSGTGTLTLSTPSAFTGATTISGGTLQLADTYSLVNSTLNYDNQGGVLSFGTLTTARLGGLSGAQDLTLTNANAQGVNLWVGGNNASTTYSGVLSGAGNLNKNGSGSLTLTGANTFIGYTATHDGTLILGNSLALQNSQFAGGAGALSFGSLTAATFGGLSGSSNLALANASGGAVALSLNVTGEASYTYSGVLSGAGSLTVSTGNGTETLTGANTFTGGTTLTAGRLSQGAAGAFVANTAYTVNGGTLDLNGYGLTMSSLSGAGGTVALGSAALTVNKTSGSATFAGAITGSGSLTKSGAGTLILTGSNTYTGGTALNAGTLQLGGSDAIGSSGTISFGGGTLQFTSANTTDYSSRFSTAAGQQYKIDTNNQNVTLASALTSSGGSLTKSGSGTLTLTAANTYTGDTTISAGTLQVGSGGASGSIAGNIVNNAALVFNRSGSLTYAGTISGAGSLTKQGGGVLTLAGSNSTFTGTTVIQNGMLLLDNVDAFRRSTLNYDNQGGVLSFGSLGNAYLGGLSGSQDLALTNANAQSVLLNVGWSNGSTTYGGILSGAGNLYKNGSGSLTLTGTNTFTGYTAVDGGALILANSLALQNSQFAGGAGALSFSGITAAAFAGLSGSSNIALANTGGAALTLTLNLPGAASYTYGGVLSGSGGLAVSTGSGAETLTGANTYTGGTTLSAGTLRQGAAGAFVANTAYTVNGGTLDLNNYALAMSSLSGNGGTVALGSAALTVNQSANTTYSGVISGTGGLTKTGAGTLTLIGTNTYTGGTTISAGTLQLGNGDTIGTVAGNIVDNANLTFNYNANTDFTGAISGTGTVTKIGTNTVRLAGTNTFAGPLTIQNGNVAIGNGGATGSITADIVTNGTLIFNRTTDYAYAGAISGSGPIFKTNTNTLTLTGANTYTGGTVVSAGTLLLEAPLFAGGNVTVAPGAALASNVAQIFSGPVVNNGTISGSGLTFAGTLSGSGAYTGSMVVSGTFSPGSSVVQVENAAFAGASRLVMELGGALPGSGYDQLAISGLVTLGGTLTINLVNGYTPAFGTTFTLFNGATSGAFDTVELPEGQWDTSRLYTLGQITAVPEPHPVLLVTAALALFILSPRYLKKIRRG